MKIDEAALEHNALALITECAENSFSPGQAQKAIEYIMGIIDMTNRMKEALKA